MRRVKLIIIGSGPAGYTAAIYAARANLAPLLFEGFFSGPAGGQLMTTTEVENYPGFAQGISGPQLMDECRNQAVRFGTEVIREDVVRVDFGKKPFEVFTQKEGFSADAVIIATGATAKRLDIEGAGDDAFWQKGVTACAVCDGAMPLFRDKELFVIGGGDTAVEDALFLTKYARKVFIVHRRGELRASKIMAARAANHPKIEILYNNVMTRIEGDKVVRAVTIQHVETKQLTKHEAGGVFFAIGHTPNTGFLGGQVQLLDHGYIAIKKPGTTYTSVEGVFAAGDVQDPFYRQAITAAGSGCMAAIDVERWLTMNSPH